MTTSILHVPDISCEHCERVVTGALAALPGVHSVAVDVPGKRVRVTYDEARTSVDRMKEVLREEDYPVASVTPA
jgi:copper chaperone CopZ